MYLQPTNSQKQVLRIYVKERKLFSINGGAKTGYVYTEEGN
jgi:hypothetical protein